MDQHFRRPKKECYRFMKLSNANQRLKVSIIRAAAILPNMWTIKPADDLTFDAF